MAEKKATKKGKANGKSTIEKIKDESSLKVTIPPSEPDIVFRSFREEGREFDIMNIRSVRNHNFPNFIEWHVPAKEAERFARHPHVRKGRARLVE